LAIGKPVDGHLKFSSGQATLDMFKRLGFQVDRSDERPQSGTEG
jgi:hypothetical protein